MSSGLKNGFLRNHVTGEMVLWCNGTEVMAFDTDKMSFFGADPATQQDTITDATDTTASDQKAPINSGIDVKEAFGLVATS